MTSAMSHEQDNVYKDFAAVRFAVIVLLLACAVQLAVGIYLMGKGMAGVDQRTTTRVGLFGLVESAFLLGFAYGAYRLRSDAVLGGFVIGCIGIATSMFTGHWAVILLNIALAALIFQAHRALRDMNKRIESQTQTNPMTQYYHRLIPILVRVMGADGHVDRRERLKISSLCNNMNISNYERNYLLKRASQRLPKPQHVSLQLLVKQFVDAGEALAHVIPDMECMYAALAVIESDGVIVPEEIDILQEIGQALGWSIEEMKQFVLQNQADLNTLDLPKAYEILNVSEGATLQQIERAYLDFTQDLNAEQFKHIGTVLAENAERRRNVLKRAYTLIKESFQ